jgi:hypothetical protein
MLAALAANAARVRPPVEVILAGVGTLYVRAVTVEEFEKLEAAEGSALAAGLARALCDENGERLPKEVLDRFAEVLAKQPTQVMHAMLDGVRGKSESSGN